MDRGSRGRGLVPLTVVPRLRRSEATPLASWAASTTHTPAAASPSPGPRGRSKR